MSMYRLVKMSLNPCGRYGAPDAEPGPAGVDMWIETDPCGRLSRAAALACASVRSDSVSAVAPVVARMAASRRNRALMDGSPLQFHFWQAGCGLDRGTPWRTECD